MKYFALETLYNELLEEVSEMLQAQLKGKLSREEEDLEDLLTSNVFGTTKYIPPEEGIIPILLSAVNRDSFPLELPTPIVKIETVHYEFWPRMSEPNCAPCEPDLLITIDCQNNQKMIILVESKFLSGKSSEASEVETPTDQLAKEWDNLTVRAERQDAVQTLLYVTADFSYPVVDVEEAQREYSRKKGKNKEMNVFWFSWRHLPDLFSNSGNPILKDLIEVLKLQGLKVFEGVSISIFLKTNWSFKGRTIRWNWNRIQGHSIHWKFRYRERYLCDWRQIEVYSTHWRFEK